MILLTVPFGRTDAKPLSVREWGRLVVWLKDDELEPSRLLTGDPKSLLSSWMDRTVTLQRIEGLLDRGGALGLALEKWERGRGGNTNAAPEGGAQAFANTCEFGCGGRI